MRKRSQCWTGIILAAAVAVVAAWSSNGWAAQAQRIGIVDMQQVLNQSARGKAVKQKLDQERLARQQEVEARQLDLQKMRADLEKQASVLSEQARRERTEVLQRKVRDIQRLVEDANRDFEKRVQDAEMEVTREILSVVQEFGKDQGFTAILERSVLLHFSPAADVTLEIIKRYDARQK